MLHADPLLAPSAVSFQFLILGWAWIIPVATAVASYFANRKKKNEGVAGLSTKQQEMVDQLLQDDVRRRQMQNPLYASTTAGVQSMLPTFARQGGQNLMDVKPPPERIGPRGSRASGPRY